MGKFVELNIGQLLVLVLVYRISYVFALKEVTGVNSSALLDIYDDPLGEPYIGGTLRHGLDRHAQGDVVSTCFSDEFMGTIASCVVQQAKNEPDMVDWFNFIISNLTHRADILYTVDEISNYARSAKKLPVVPSMAALTNQTIILTTEDIDYRKKIDGIQAHNRYLSRILG